ncbi:MAG: hypothetical protein AAGH73_06325, partial [Pseudomonadota bacterium]
MRMLSGLGRVPVGFFLGLAAGLTVLSAATEGIMVAVIGAGLGALVWGGVMLWAKLEERLSGWIFGGARAGAAHDPDAGSDRGPRAYFWVPAGLGFLAGLLLTTAQIDRLL